MNDVEDSNATDARQKSLEVVSIDPPPERLRARRDPEFAGDDEKKNRYHLPEGLESPSPVGYRHRLRIEREEAEELMALLELERPREFVEPEDSIREQELFEEVSLGVLTSRQSTNFRGHREVVVGPEESRKVAALMQRLEGREAPVLEGATHTHLVFSRPYRTLFTLLLTFVGHSPLLSLATVPLRALRKKLFHEATIPTVDYLQHLHVGILADEMERAALVASRGSRRAQVFMAPFAGRHGERNASLVRDIEKLAGLTGAERRDGWELALVAQTGEVPVDQRIELSDELWRRFGANKVAFRSERIQPGENPDENASEAYQRPQEMEVPEQLRVQCGRAAYNAFCHWTGVERSRAKEIMLLDRIDARSEDDRDRMQEVREMLDSVTDQLIDGLPLWADLLSGFALSRNAEQGRKAFALAGQRVYIGGLDADEVEAAGLDWYRAVRATGAASARAALYAEIMGCVDLPDDCDLLAGICQMAGPVNQNDIGKEFYGQSDLLEATHPSGNPTSLLIWTLKAKTVADPIGNEEQLLNDDRQGALVDLRPGPHEIVDLMEDGERRSMRSRNGRTNEERAFGEAGNFAPAARDVEIPGNRGEKWPESWRDEVLW